jgi:hypothetical protein
LIKEGIRRKEIPGRLRNVYGEEAMKKTQVFFSVAEVRRRRENLSDEERPGRPATPGLDEILAYRLARDSHTMTSRLTTSLSISHQTVLTRLHHSFKMKCYHLRWVPQVLGDDRKSKRIRYAEAMITTLGDHSQTGFKYRLTGDELWITYDQTPIRMWALDRSCSDERVRSTNHSKKTMVTFCFSGDGIALLDILSSGLKFTSGYFCSNVIEALAGVLYPDGRRPRTVRYMLHFDNALVHNAEKVQHELDECGFRRVEHPLYSPDLSPFDFFRFGYLHAKMKFLSCQLWRSLRRPLHGHLRRFRDHT